MTEAALHLVNPKIPFNVGSAIRAAAVFEAQRVTWSGTRVHDGPVKGATTVGKRKWRLPREERMKAYDVDWSRVDSDVCLINDTDMVPVCIEVLQNSESLEEFDHPEQALYIFGPEDGGVPGAVRAVCHRFVTIPSKHCLNVAAAVNVVLYDRALQHGFPDE